jgi:hypothetical protein
MTIAITALTRKTAIMRLFRHCGAGREGAPVLLTVLMTAWTQLGLRGEDLSTGLNEMLEDASLALSMDPKNPSVSLTAAGKAWFDGVGVDPRQRLEQERILAEVQQRAGKRPPEIPGQEPRWRIVDRRLQLD